MKKTGKLLFTFFSLLVIVGFSVYQLQEKVFAEQSGSSPESGATSRIKIIYDSLVSLSHGSESAGGWGDWGAMWNRIRSAAEWVPESGLSASEVAEGEIFFSGSRSSQTGTALSPVDWSMQSLQDYDDYRNGDYSGEEGIWENTAGDAGTGVWKDTRTGLYWSASRGAQSNLFSRSTCNFFTTIPRGSYDGLDSDCGNAINLCGLLSIDANGDGNPETDWYLPSQKELLSAYLDGIYNQTGVGFINNEYWSSTEAGFNTTYAFIVDLTRASAFYDSKSYLGSTHVGCVRRD